MRPFQHLAIRTVYLQPGELFVERQPAVVETILGSCVSVTMFYPPSGFGGICHALLPSASAPDDPPGRSVEGAVILLLERMLLLGAERNRLTIKLFGGSSVLGVAADHRTSVGSQNVAHARELLQRLSLAIQTADTGGRQGRRLYFNSGSGEVFVRKVRGPARGHQA